MKLKIDKDALYLRLDESAIVESEEVQPGVILDYDESGQVVGIELFGLSVGAQPEKLRVLQFESAY